jgi:hypothetical protein
MTQKHSWKPQPPQLRAAKVATPVNCLSAIVWLRVTCEVCSSCSQHDASAQFLTQHATILERKAVLGATIAPQAFPNG